MEQFKENTENQRTKEEITADIESRVSLEAKKVVDNIIFDVLGRNALSEWITNEHAGCLGCGNGWPKFKDMPKDVQSAWKELFGNKDTSKGLPQLDQNKLDEASKKYGIKVHNGSPYSDGSASGIGIAGSTCGSIGGSYGSVKNELLKKETSYRPDLAKLLKNIDDKEERLEFIETERENPSYVDSKDLHQLEMKEKQQKRTEEKRRQKNDLMHNIQNRFADSLTIEWPQGTIDFFQKKYEISDEEIREVAEKGITRYFWKLISDTPEAIDIDNEKIKKFIERFNFSQGEVKKLIIEAYLDHDIYYEPEKAVNISNHLKSKEGGLLEQGDVELISEDLIFSNVRSDTAPGRDGGGKWDIIAVPLIFQRELGISEEVFNTAWERAIANRICSEQSSGSGTMFGSDFEENTRYARAFAAFGISQDTKQEGVSQGVKRAVTAEYDLSYQHIHQREDGVVKGFTKIRNYFGPGVLSNALKATEMSDSFLGLVKNGLNRACAELMEKRNTTKARETEEGWNKFDREAKQQALKNFGVQAKEYEAIIQELSLDKDFEEFLKKFDLVY